VIPLQFDPAARAELRAASRWYEQRRPGLGPEFARAVSRTILRIRQLPRSAPLTVAGARRARVERFPFGVVYLLHEDALIVIAIAHEHRTPDYWKRRSL